MRAAVKQANRSGLQRCAVCETPQVLIVHHIYGRNVPDWDKPHSVVSLCDNCHRKIHTDNGRRLIIERWVMTTNGRKLLWHMEGEPSITGEDAAPPLFSGRV